MKKRFNSHSDQIPYRVARGDVLLEELLFAPDTIRRGLDRLAQYSNLARTPEMVHRFEEVLQRRFESDKGWDNFEMPNFAVYEDGQLASFYGCEGLRTENVKTRRETYQEIVERLIAETVDEIAPEMAGLSQMHDHFNNESWARYGVAEEAPFCHADPDVTLFRNPEKGWAGISLPAATSQKSNVIDMYQGDPDFTFATPHEGWLVDQRGGFYDQPGSTAFGF